MATLAQIRNELIENIQTIKNKDLLEDLSNIVAFRNESTEPIRLSKYQKLMLEMSEEDFKHGRTISHEDLIKKTKEWLKD